MVKELSSNENLQKKYYNKISHFMIIILLINMRSNIDLWYTIKYLKEFI
jgi:hypothetical protein